MKRKTYIPFDSENIDSIDYLLGILDDTRFTTFQRVEDIAVEELHWQYDKEWNSIGVLLSHIMSSENFFRIHFIEERGLTEIENKEYIPGLEMGKYIPQLITDYPINYYIEELEKSRTLLINEIKKISKTNFYRKREGYNKKTGYNLAWALYHMAEDEVHHRGQISIIRKLYKKMK